ncbi:hypothetical protein B7494_g5069 [Chlorociboria aeruginascens]|nr:hypothetical protein B7494_g5069 [Chlorociboria aeruginascens]
MHASSLKNSFIALAAFASTVSANPARRQTTESGLDPWVTVDTSGKPSTVTPVLTTISGQATTISPAPASLTTTSSTTPSDSKPSTTSGAAVPTSTGGGAFQVCHNTDGDFAPFCKPDNGSSVYVGETYYVTWDTSVFSAYGKNSTVLIQANYVNASGGGAQAFQSSITTNSWGFVAWTIDKAWLKGGSSNNLTLFITPSNPAADEPTSIEGPTLMVTNSPAPEPYRQTPAKAPTGQSLYIALPTVFGFIIVCVCGGFFLNRKNRKIGLGNVMGRRGYGIGESRTQRMGIGKKKAAAIRLREQELTSEGQYRDAPLEHERPRGHLRNDSDALGSLAGTPTEERTNYFRDELDRQNREDESRSR